MIVSLFGHARIDHETDLRLWLHKNIELLVNKGANTFLLGGYGQFDNIAASVVHNIKKKYPDIKSCLVLPYLNRPITSDLYDETIYPPIERTPQKYAIVKRNYWMVDQSTTIIAYVLHSYGGAANTLEYAKKKNKNIIHYMPFKQDE